MTKGLPRPAQLPMHMRRNGQADAELQIHPITALHAHALHSTLSTNLPPKAHEQVEPMKYLPRVGLVGLALLYRRRSPRLGKR
jgi:hypothetical protein